MGAIFNLWRIVYTGSFEKALEKLGGDVALRIIREAKVLSENPYVGRIL